MNFKASCPNGFAVVRAEGFAWWVELTRVERTSWRINAENTDSRVAMLALDAALAIDEFLDADPTLLVNIL